MTREELIEKVAKSICTDWGYLWEGDKDDMQVIADNEEPYDERPSKRLFKLAAEGVVNTIFDALKEPTGKMTDASRHLMLWLGDNRPTEKALAFWCERRGLPIPEGCCDVDHVPPKAQQAAWVFQAMIAASPLAQEEKK